MEISRIKTTRIAGTIFMPVLFCGLTFICFNLFHFWGHNSDDSNSLLASAEIFRGNPLLRGWSMPPDSFYATDLIWSGLLTRIFGVTPVIFVLLPAMIWAAIVCFSLWAADRLRPIDGKFGRLWVFVVLGIPLLTGGRAMTLIGTAPMHIATTLYSGLIFFMARHYVFALKRSPITLVAIFAFLAITVASDPFALFIAAGPIFLASVAYWSMTRERSILWLALVAVAGAGAGKAAIGLLAVVGGMTSASQPLVFDDFAGLGHNLANIINGGMVIFGADFTGRSLTPPSGMPFTHYIAASPIGMALRLPLFVAAIACCYIFWRTVIRKIASGRTQSLSRVPDFALVCMAASMAITVVSAFVSNQLVDLSSTRYFVPVLIFGAILTAVMVPRNVASVCYLYMVGIVSAVFCFTSYTVTAPMNTYGGADAEQLASWLQGSQLTDGYAPYWTASLVTVLSNGESRVRALVPAESGKLEPFQWLANREWYAAPGTNQKRFVVIYNFPMPLNFSEQQAESTFGKPAEIHDVGRYRVLVYSTSSTDFSSVSLL